MAKPKAASPPKSKVAATPSRAKAAKPPEPTELQRFYVEGNLTALTDAELAKATGLKVAQVRKIREEYEGSRDTRVTRFEDMLHRPAQGVVAMTGAASEVADDGTSGMVTQDMINRAAAAQDFKLAAELAEKKAKQEAHSKAAFRAKNAGHIHFIGGDDARR